MAFFPEPLGDLEWLNLEVFPPNDFVAGLMQLPMMTAAERDGELVADLETNGPRLGKPYVMRVARLPATNETRL